MILYWGIITRKYPTWGNKTRHGMNEVLIKSEPKEVVLHNDKVELYERNTPIDFSILNTAMFSKNKKDLKGEKKIILDNGGSLKIEPSHGSNRPSVFEQNLYFAILKLIFDQKLLTKRIPKSFYTTYSELIKTLGLDPKYYKASVLRAALDRLAKTSYTFENSFLQRGIPDDFDGDDNKVTNYSIKKVEERVVYQLLNFVEYKVTNLNLNAELKNNHNVSDDEFDIYSSIANSKINSKSNYFLRIDLSTYCYENLVNKVYLLHSLDHIINIDPIAQAVFLFVDFNKGNLVKNGFYSALSNKNVSILPAAQLARYVPLSFTTDSASTSLNTLNTAFLYLKNNGYIQDFIFHEESPLTLSRYTVYFHGYQSRHGDLQRYSARKVGTVENNNSKLNKSQSIEYNFPEEIQLSIKELGLTTEVCEKLFEMYNSEKDISVNYKGMELNCSLGLLKARAILKKISQAHVKNPSGYFFSIAAEPKFEDFLIKEKFDEYAKISSSKIKDNKINEKKRSSEKFIRNRSEIEELWKNLSDNEKVQYLEKAEKTYKIISVKIQSYSIEVIAMHLYAKAIDKVYDRGIDFFLGDFPN